MSSPGARRRAPAACLCLYVAGESAHSAAARKVLESLVMHPEFAGHVSTRVVDVAREPQRAREAELTATPTLLLKHGNRRMRFIGDLSDTAQVVDYLRGVVRGPGSEAH